MEKTYLTTPTDDALAPGTRIAGYTLSRKISEGGMGEVYEGVQRALKRRVAVKLLATWATGRADLRARFLREGETAARIRHHNIVEIYDVGVWGERPYIVMEFLDGRTLEEFIQLEGALPEAQAVDLMLPVLSAIGAANDRGIIHRDIKPENVFIADTDSGVEPKVLDFGISRVVTSHEPSIDTQNVGTPHYMSPEQARGEPVDGRSDQYSIAIVLYEMVTGHLPRDHELVTTLMRMVAHEDFVHPHEHLATLSDAMVDVLMCGLAATPDERFDDLQDMMRALVPLASERARSYWTAELWGDAEPGRVVERPPVSGSHRAIVGGPSLASGQELEALPGEETQSEIIAPNSPDLVNAPKLVERSPAQHRVPASDDLPPQEQKRAPWLLFASAAIVLLMAGGWFLSQRDTPRLTGERAPEPSATAAPREAVIDDESGMEEVVEETIAEGGVDGVDDGVDDGGEDAVVEHSERAAEHADDNEVSTLLDEGAERSEPAPSATTPPARTPAQLARAERRAAMRALAEAPAPPAPAPQTPIVAPPEPATMTMTMANPSWEPTGSSDNVDPWN